MPRALGQFTAAQFAALQDALAVRLHATTSAEVAPPPAAPARAGFRTRDEFARSR
ncbi:MAG TPA: hypothetical protein VFZ00_01455 [Solirubrobacter sp.]|nr:hypothetical protein [Solirubrobacter sp.]